MAGEGSLLAAGGQVPDPQGAVAAAADRAGAVRGDGHCPHRAGVAGQDGPLRLAVRSQTRTVRSLPPLTAQVPSGLSATEKTSPVWPVRAASWRPVARSQTRRVPSSLPLTARAPSSLTATARTQSVWPVRAASWRPVARFHTRTVPSSLPLTARAPSWLTATARTGPVWPVRICLNRSTGDSRADHRRQPGPRRCPTGKASGPGGDTGIWMTQQAVGEMGPDERRVGGQRRGRYPQGPDDLASERIAGIPVVTNELMCRSVGEAGLDPLGVGKNSAQFAAEMCVVQVTG